MARGEVLFVHDVVICESVWVLESAYGYTRAQIAAALVKLLSVDELELNGGT